MSKRVYISADYSEVNGDRDVVEELHKWGKDNLHKVDYVDTAEVVSGSVSNDPDCRPCDLKKEFNKQINASSVVIFIIGDKTASRTAGSVCRRYNGEAGCECTPYKQNSKGTSTCKWDMVSTPGPNDDLGNINTYSYLKHEFLQAKRKKRTIIIVYNSLNKQPSWLPDYMKEYEEEAYAFWTKDILGNKIGDYYHIKKDLGYD
ncbi:hypothetical protein [Intestinimonas massiliensis (ex Afouda et al. 2020)]|uniref:hypothetical protein n=1 Tax=Intestinimonas massiliensis (ex Afouda et al. 2020) TaxID=1673721 RepID=UPI00102FD6E5|nr:hypothetical protein [Intestinimonas massiliensis (ex Afouda et al. 2020)]